MATISSIGIGSGLDANTIITQLVALEKTQLNTLTSEANLIKNRISGVSQMKSLAANLKDKLAILADSSSWKNAMKASSSDESNLVATVAEGATVGKYDINITKLASSESVTSKAYANDYSFSGAGSLSIKIGNGSAKNVDIADGATLLQVAQAINNAGAGVSASIMNDGTGQRLIIGSKETGLSGAFEISSSGGAFSALEHNGTSSALATGGLWRSAVDAEAEVNGIPVISSSNSFKDTLSGVTFTAKKVGASSLEVSSDDELLKKQINEFVEAYNAMNNYLSSSTKYDDSTKVAGIFQADSSILSLQNSLRNAVTGSVSTGGSYSFLSQIGIEMKVGGTLTANTSKLQKAFADPIELEKFFSEGTNGIADKLYSYVNSILSFDGILENKAKALQVSVDQNLKKQDRVNDRAASVEARLIAQYSALDTKMASMNVLSSYVSQQISQWNKSSS